MPFRVCIRHLVCTWLCLSLGPSTTCLTPAIPVTTRSPRSLLTSHECDRQHLGYTSGLGLQLSSSLPCLRHKGSQDPPGNLAVSIQKCRGIHAPWRASSHGSGRVEEVSSFLPLLWPPWYSGSIGSWETILWELSFTCHEMAASSVTYLHWDCSLSSLPLPSWYFPGHLVPSKVVGYKLLHWLCPLGPRPAITELGCLGLGHF